MLEILFFPSPVLAGNVEGHCYALVGLCRKSLEPEKSSIECHRSCGIIHFSGRVRTMLLDDSVRKDVTMRLSIEINDR